MRALVVDDNPTSREIFQKMLESFTFFVKLTASGEDGLKEIERAAGDHPYDIVIMDWKMPGMDGFDVARRIRQNSRLSKKPIIVLVSAYGREDIMWKAEIAGLDAFLNKPVSPSVMFDTLMHTLSKGASGEVKPGTRKDQGSNISKSLEGARILIVEDNELNQQVAVELLANAGAVTSLAGNGQEALDMVRTARFDAVLMDVQMPLMDGYTATRRIRQELHMADLPIIAMTAHAMAGDQEKSAAAGMNDHITKPIDPIQLYAVLSRWISAGSTSRKFPPERPQEIDTVNVASAMPVKAPLLPESLDGFDLADGLKRLQGNDALYRKLLMGFAARYARIADDILSALNTVDYPVAHHMVHDIKGLAGNLSAHPLRIAAAELEKRLKHDGIKSSGPPEESIRNAFGAFEIELSRALKSAGGFEPSSTGTESAPPSDASALPDSLAELSPETAREAATRLREAAELGDVSGIKAISEEYAIRSDAFSLCRTHLDRLADDFDFEGVIRLTEKLSTAVKD